MIGFCFLYCGVLCDPFLHDVYGAGAQAQSWAGVRLRRRCSAWL